MFDDSSPSVLSRKATQASKLDEAGIGAELELALDDAELVLDDAELVLEDAGLVLEDAELVAADDESAGLGVGVAGWGSGSGVAWNPAGGMVRTWPTISRYGAERWFSSTIAYQGDPKRWPTDNALSPGCTV